MFSQVGFGKDGCVEEGLGWFVHLAMSSGAERGRGRGGVKS